MKSGRTLARFWRRSSTEHLGYAAPVRNQPRALLLLVVVVVLAVAGGACGGAGTEGTLTPTGGELCLPDKKVCLSVPSGGLAESRALRIAASADVPAGALSEGYDISAVDGRAVEFLKRAKVSFSLDLVNAEGVPNDTLLRLYTRVGDDWQPLENAFVDRVRHVVTGETSHLSPFVVLRADRLPDGGMPVELDGGKRDAGVIVVPRYDGGRPDAGRSDAGPPDAGAVDAGVVDGGQGDGGGGDAGVDDGGLPDAGAPDAGEPDAGTPDAGEVDAGASNQDAGAQDAGDPDAGPGPSDAGLDDGGVDAG